MENKKNERIPRQIVFMETELCHFVSFGPNTPSNAVQGPVPHRHLLAGFGDLILEEGGCEPGGDLPASPALCRNRCLAVPSDHTAGQAEKASGYQAPGPQYVKSVLWLFSFSVRSV